MTEDWREGGFGLYVHWPFCQAKCPYCDFNSHVVAQIDQARWADALASEIRRQAALVPDRVLNSIFFGGGTPSLMLPQTVEAVLKAASDGWRWANDIEITLEANPTSVDAGRFEGYALAGVNRVSLGVQALREADLKALGRLHSVAEARAAFEIARHQFDRVSFDLIYGRQSQSLQDWESELSEALDMAVDHLSLYQLTIEPGTAFWDRQQKGGLTALPDEDLSADLFELTNAVCNAAGMPAYEVSNHARPGSESRHNLVYWRSGDWCGVGPGAHGRLTIDGKRLATVDVSAPGAWLSRVESGDTGGSFSPLNIQDIVGEHIMMGLRLSEGIQLKRLHMSSNAHELDQKLRGLVEDGLLWIESDRVGTTPHGRLLLNAVIAELIP